MANQLKPISKEYLMSSLKGFEKYILNKKYQEKVTDNSHNHKVENISDLSASASELNVLDGITASTEELNHITGVTDNIQVQLDGVTTSKVNISDIIDELTSTASNKPLSANQGKVLNDLITTLTTDVGDKVDKISGKGLSTNDYTTTEKNKLDGIASGANVNVQADWNVTDNNSDAFIKNKPTSMPASDVYEWAKSETKPEYSKSEIGLDKVPNVSTNNQTPTFTEATTRTNIASGEKLSVIFGKIMKWFTDLKNVAFSGSYNDLSDKPTIPTKTSELTNDSGYTATDYGVVSKTADGLVPQLPNETTTTKYLRQDGTWSVPPDTNTTYAAATQSANGLMTAADKKKLDGIDVSNLATNVAYPGGTNANGTPKIYLVASTRSATIPSYGQSHRFHSTLLFTSDDEYIGILNIAIQSGGVDIFITPILGASQYTGTDQEFVNQWGYSVIIAITNSYGTDGIEYGVDVYAFSKTSSISVSLLAASNDGNAKFDSYRGGIHITRDPITLVSTSSGTATMDEIVDKNAESNFNPPSIYKFTINRPS